MQISQILNPCVTCGESLIFGHFAPQGDVLKLNEGWSRVRCPACQALGPVRTSFRDACDAWNGLVLKKSEPGIVAQLPVGLPPRADIPATHAPRR